MRDLGKALTLVGAAAVGLGLVGCGQGAPGERAGEAVGYVIVDRAAREAGVRIDGVSAADAVLPVEVEPASRHTLVGPMGRVPIAVEADEVVYVRGRDARVERGTLDAAVARDRLAVIGSEGAARALAEEVGGVVDDHAGRFVVVGPEAIGGIARASTPDGLDEVVPVAPGDAAGWPAFGVVAVNRGEVEREAMRQIVPAGEGFDLSAWTRARIEEPADALLPEVVQCADPIAGTWVSREHYPEHQDWYRFELVVRRDAQDPSRILGTIVSRSWSGSAQQSVPAACPQDEPAFDWTVRMPASGIFAGGEIGLDGRAAHVDATRCGPSFAASRYNVDHFRGELVEGGRFLRAVNNDGDRAVDEPHLFRRIACH